MVDLSLDAMLDLEVHGLELADPDLEPELDRTVFLSEDIGLLAGFCPPNSRLCFVLGSQ